MAAFSTLISIAVHFFEHFTGSFVEETLERKFEDSLEDSYVTSESLPELSSGLVADLERDFTRHDPSDCVYEEYKGPSYSNDRFAWTFARSSAVTSVFKSMATVSGITVAAGMTMGTISALLVFLSLNTVGLCHWKDDRELPARIREIRFVSFVITSPFIYCHSAVFLTLVFNWLLIKEKNLFLICLICSFLDIVYRLLLRLFDAYTYTSFVLPYPQNIMFFVVSVLNIYRVSRTVHPHCVRKAVKLCFKLSAQYVIGMPLIYVILYVVCRYYPAVPHGNLRIVLVGVTGLLVLVFKAFFRLWVSGLEGVIHPGKCFLLVSGWYSTCAIILRVLQVEQWKFYLYCVIGVVHGISFVIERAAVPVTDYLLRKLFNSSQSYIKYKTPRSQRFIADISINTMMFESSGLIISLATTLFYKVLYSKLTEEKRNELLFEFLKRMISGLAIEWFFNVIAVFIQTRYMNIAVFSVWKLKWKRHLGFGIIVSIAAILCFNTYLLGVVRSQESHMETIIDNCTVLPFSGYHMAHVGLKRKF